MTAMARSRVKSPYRLQTSSDRRVCGRARWVLGAAAAWAAAVLHAQSPGGAQAPPDTQPEDGAAEVAPAPEESARVVTRFEAEIEMQRLADEERYAEAVEIGEQLIPLTEAEFGPNSRETAAAYAALANVERSLGEHQAAEESYLRALAIYRDLEGSFAGVLIEPLLGLGDNYHDDGQYVNAVSAYNEARTVSRRVDGLLNEGQIVMLDRMTKSFERLDQLAEAQTQQLEALNLVARNHDIASTEYLESLYKYGYWLRGSHRYNEEREQYFRAERIIQDAYGDESALLVRPLRERAISFRVQGNAASQGISGLRDALAILEAQEAPDPLLMGQVLRDIGDWEVAFGRVTTDGANYRQSWRALANVPNGEQLRREWYEGIEFVFSAPLSRRGLSNDPQAPRGRVLVRFDIDQYGRSDNVTVIASEPPGLKDEAVARHIRQSRFRPNIMNGELVATRNRALDIIFRYTQDEE